MARLLVVTHPEVTVDPATPVPDWGLAATGLRRAETFAASDTMSGVSHIWSSTERKARETAGILAASRSLPVNIDPDLGENDRSATGFLSPAEFEAAADAFFARPLDSFRGWERAVDAQNRILGATRRIVADHRGRDLVLVTHGAVGTLLWCALTQAPIDRSHDQPGQGHFWVADLKTLRPQHGWRSIA